MTELLKALLERGAELFGVGDTAQVLADDLVERARADAAAVLVPDGPIWRVSGGIGLRPLERRIMLDAGQWLIAQVAVGGHNLVLQDGGGARDRLAGTPLASWPHLMAMPIPQVQAMVLLARGPAAPPFGEADLATIAGPVTEASNLLRTALRTRDLARLLSALRDDDRPGLG